MDSPVFLDDIYCTSTHRVWPVVELARTSDSVLISPYPSVETPWIRQSIVGSISESVCDQRL